MGECECAIRVRVLGFCVFLELQHETRHGVQHVCGMVLVGEASMTLTLTNKKKDKRKVEHESMLLSPLRLCVLSFQLHSFSLFLCH